MTPDNLLAYAAQVTIIVVTCAGLPRLLRLRSPGVQYAFWRTILLLCLLLPFVQPWRPAERTFVPAEVAFVPAGAPAPADVAPPAGATAASRFDPVAVGAAVVLLGIGTRLAWIATGMIGLRRIRRRATEAALGFDDLRQAIGSSAPILWSSEVWHPVTFGLFDPVVLLPLALRDAEPGAQRAVVAHELHHVTRRDWGWVVTEEVVRSIFWFHPAVWWLVSRVQLARETVVDELSILATNARRTYLDTLLAFADDTRLGSSPAFSARRHLFHRVMLLSQEGEMSSIRVALGSCVLILALGAGTVEAVKAFPLYGEWQQPAPPRDKQRPPRDPISADAHHRAAVEYWDKVRRETTLSAAEKRVLILSGIAAEDRALELRPDFIEALTYKNILLRMQALLSDDVQETNDLLKQADAIRNRVIALHAAAPHEMVFSPAPPRSTPPPARASEGIDVRPEGVPPPPAREPQGGGGVMVFVPAPTGGADYEALFDQLKPVRIGGGIKTPAKIRDVKPFYPPIARSAGVQGVVILEVLIDGSGQVSEARVLRSIPLLDQAALDAVKQWEFMPTLLNGTPTPVVMTVTVNFTLQ